MNRAYVYAKQHMVINGKVLQKGEAVLVCVPVTERNQLLVVSHNRVRVTVDPIDFEYPKRLMQV